MLTCNSRRCGALEEGTIDVLIPRGLGTEAEGDTRGITTVPAGWEMLTRDCDTATPVIVRAMSCSLDPDSWGECCKEDCGTDLPVWASLWMTVWVCLTLSMSRWISVPLGP